MDKTDLSGFMSPEAYDSLVAEASNLIRSGEAPEAIADALILRISAALEEHTKKRRKAAQAEGIARARANGVHLGRRRKEFPPFFPQVLDQVQAGGITVEAAAKLCGVGIRTFYRLKKRAESEADQSQADT